MQGRPRASLHLSDDEVFSYSSRFVFYSGGTQRAENLVTSPKIGYQMDNEDLQWLQHQPAGFLAQLRPGFLELFMDYLDKNGPLPLVRVLETLQGYADREVLIPLWDHWHQKNGHQQRTLWSQLDLPPPASHHFTPSSLALPSVAHSYFAVNTPRPDARFVLPAPTKTEPESSPSREGRTEHLQTEAAAALLLLVNSSSSKTIAPAPHSRGYHYDRHPAESEKARGRSPSPVRERPLRRDERPRPVPDWISEEPKEDRRRFWDSLCEEREEAGSPITALPFLSYRQIDLYDLFKQVSLRGGMDSVTQNKQWRQVARILGVPSTVTNASFALRGNYRKYLYGYELKYSPKNGGKKPKSTPSPQEVAQLLAPPTKPQCPLSPKPQRPPNLAVTMPSPPHSPLPQSHTEQPCSSPSPIPPPTELAPPAPTLAPPSPSPTPAPQITPNLFVENADAPLIPTLERPEALLLSCTDCCYTSFQRSALTRHRLRMHTGTANASQPLSPQAPLQPSASAVVYQCPTCPYLSSKRSGLSRHKRRMHRSPDDLLPDSGPEVTLDPLPDVHPVFVDGKKRFNCPHCSYYTPHRGHLGQHVRIHTGDKPFKCEHCDYATTRKSSLTDHLLAHFERASQQQSAVDAGVLLWRCNAENCKYHTNKKSSLARHRRRMHPSRPAGQSDNSPASRSSSKSPPSFALTTVKSPPSFALTTEGE